MIPEHKLNEIHERFQFLEAKMSQGLSPDDLAVSAKEYADLKPVVDRIIEYKSVLAEIEDATELSRDPEMLDIAEEELLDLNNRLPDLEKTVLLSLLPKDKSDTKPAILEIRAGTGGDEAALFVGDLLRMYQKFADQSGWKLEMLSEAATELGGYREVICSVKGKDVFARLKFESGVHRVQRVPTTESGGRIHTSAATVAVLPELDAVELEIPPNDIRIDTMRASGAGGQHVNTTDSAVRITHIPSGIVVTSSEKSQHRNRELAMQVLRARLFDLEQSKRNEKLAEERKGQVGTGDRSERIRTYNFPQGRITDHRINLTLYKLDQVLAGDLTEIVDAITAEDQANKLAELDV